MPAWRAAGLIPAARPQLARELDLRLESCSAANAYKAYWAALAAGKEADGRAALQRCAGRGVPLPLPMK
ncbi:MAG TPA: hypothetical protein VFA26_22990 [Gemmataceae bacterium]|nr:hypothetical protein [Gemmataceae bacterium]